MELAELIADIKREGKVSVDNLLMTMADAIQKGEDPSDIYKNLYKKAYGEHLSEPICRKWVEDMSCGQHWSYDQTTEIGQKLGINWGNMTKWEWYCAMNAAYSDYHKVGVEYQIDDDPEFYGWLAKMFWIEDDDVKNKTIFDYYFRYAA